MKSLHTNNIYSFPIYIHTPQSPINSNSCNNLYLSIQKHNINISKLKLTWSKLRYHHRNIRRHDYKTKSAKELLNYKIDIDDVNNVMSDLAIMAPETALIISIILRPLLLISELMMIVRIVLAWYPETKIDKLPWLLVYKPTEPILKITRKIIPPAFGVDISPIIWFGILSFINEILLGPQGILNLIQIQ